jgi:hypothetical protein
VSVDVITQVTLGEGSNVLLRSQNGASQTSSLEGSGVQVVQDKLFLLLVDLGHFSQNNIAFSLNGILIEVGVEEDIRENLECLTNVLLEDLGKVNGLLTRSVGVPENIKGRELVRISFVTYRTPFYTEHKILQFHLIAPIFNLQVSTHVLDFNLQLLLSSLGSTLESHVLQKVSGTIVLCRFVT